MQAISVHFASIGLVLCGFSPTRHTNARGKVKVGTLTSDKLSNLHFPSTMPSCEAKKEATFDPAPLPRDERKLRVWIRF